MARKKTTPVHCLPDAKRRCTEPPRKNKAVICNQFWQQTVLALRGLDQAAGLTCTLPHLRHLQELTLLDLSLTQLPICITTTLAPTLRTLCVRRNQLTNLDALCNMQVLQSLDYACNNVKGLPADFTRLDQLTRLDMSSNYQWGRLPPVVWRLPRLKALVADDTGVCEIFPPEIAQATALECLNCSYYCATDLPPEMAALTNLKLVSMRSGRFERLPAVLTRLPGLELLNLTNNYLSDLGPGLGRMTSLQHLYLAGNFLRELPDELGQLGKLIWLDCSRNPLLRLPCTIGWLQSLVHLDIKETRVFNVPSNIMCARRLCKFVCDEPDFTASLIRALVPSFNKADSAPSILYFSDYASKSPSPREESSCATALDSECDDEEVNSCFSCCCQTKNY